MVRLTPTRLLCAVVFLCTFIAFFSSSSLFFGRRGFDIMLERPPPSRSRPSAPNVPFGDECAPFLSGAMDDVTVVVKMTSSDVKPQLRSFLGRFGRCRVDILLFSDREQEFGGWKVIDALANLKPEYRYNNPDFEVYDEIQRSNGTSEKVNEGWRLDRYKFLPMMELTAHMRPETNWFIFVEMNSYVNWDNMYRFLAKFNPETPHYFGSPVWPKKRPTFAHGGSGFVVSRGTMNRVVARGRMFAENHRFPGTHFFGKNVRNECCGDEVLAHVLKDCGVKVRGYWPMFNGEKPTTVKFGPEHWCEAVLTLHNMGDGDFDDLWRWETNRQQPSKPLTFEDLYTYVESAIVDEKDDWSNMSEDVILKGSKGAGKSVDACKAACGKDKRCFQYEHFGDTCRLAHVIRLGHGQAPEGNAKWTSGWMRGRIGEFRKANSPCSGAHFVHPNP
ncbi:glycosyltransferase family 31 protein [Aaosphaeria arxii CBS 175.79]|uniref:N-acetylgalactosaminide beta-1,3-galactosyltransferase n=1 Tax=Aaosphaeria arxii CBS 175.79 TaxID=1450172 RepID=A0A6A5Y9T4_9PLEO|nr:glycosyltransferase family 31 protein [Aaosphaeria arxii CBS 175.79]KAF2022342.1 glycosyltransferase family 31 protein [Aaosphaeria arxii CBS 175.79]